MQVEVYEREIDAVEAAAAEVAARIVAAGEAATVALPGGRRGRALLAALAAHGEVPWASTRWFVTDDVCGHEAGADSARELLMMTVLAPNRVPASTLSVPKRELPPADAARLWESELDAVAAASSGLAVIVLVAGPDGTVAGLQPGGPAAGSVVVGGGGRVSIGAAVIAAARTIVVVGTGSGVQVAVREALTAQPDPASRPLQRVLPDAARVVWFVDRAAVTGLVADAHVVAD